MSLYELREQRTKLCADERAQLDRLELAGKKHMDANDQAEYEKRAAEIDRIEEQINGAERLEQARQRSKDRAAHSEQYRTEAERSAKAEETTSVTSLSGFMRALHRADQGALERGLVKADDSKGGIFAPPEFETEIMKTVTELTAMRSLARTSTITGHALQFPKRTGTPTAFWVSENGTRQDAGNMTYALDEIRAHEMACYVDLSAQLQQDSIINFESELRTEVTEQFAVLEAQAFISGNAIGKPWGLTVDTAITDTKTGTDGALGASDAAIGDFLIDQRYGLKEAYQRNAVWLMNRATMRRIRKVKANSEYVWLPNGATNQQGLTVGVSGSLLDAPVVLVPEMQATGTTGNISLIYGDIRRAYRIVDRAGLSVVVDNITQRGVGNIRYWFNKRVGGQVYQPEAVIRIKESA